jgi:hypothetical protein
MRAELSTGKASGGFSYLGSGRREKSVQRPS